jgi:hypothetical protein
MPRKAAPRNILLRRKILRGIMRGQGGKTISRELGLSRTGFGSHIIALKRRLKPNNAERLKAKIIGNLPRKFTHDKARQIISLAQKIMAGEAGLPELQRKILRDPLSKIPPEKTARIREALLKTKKHIWQIARENKTSPKTVSRIFASAAPQGAQRKPGGIQRKESRKTGFFTEQQISGIVQQREPQITQTANRFYWAYRSFFDRANILPEEIADYIRSGLHWKLETFSPRKPQNQLAEEISKLCAAQIRYLALDKKKAATRKARGVLSLQQKLFETDTGKERTKADFVAARPEQSVGLAELIETANRTAERAKLAPAEKAVMFGIAAGLKQAELSRLAGVGKSLISQLAKSARKKIAAAGIRPE